MGSPTIPLEWFYETIIKRTSPPYNIPLNELFLLVPHEDEAEFEYEIKPTPYYPFAPSGKIRVFFLKPHKLIASTGEVAKLNKEVSGLNLATPRILWVKKFKYPKVSQVSSRKTKRKFELKKSSQFN